MNLKVGDVVRIKTTAPEVLQYNNTLGEIEEIVKDASYTHLVRMDSQLMSFKPDELELAQDNFDLSDKDYVVQSKYWERLNKCSEIAKKREGQYGEVTDNFKQILEVLNSISSKQYTIQDYCDVMIATKLARRKYNPNHLDNDDDLINYVAISAHIKSLDKDNL